MHNGLMYVFVIINLEAELPSSPSLCGHRVCGDRDISHDGQIVALELELLAIETAVFFPLTFYFYCVFFGNSRTR